MKKTVLVGLLLLAATALFSQKLADAEKLITKEVVNITSYLKTSKETLEVKRDKVRVQVDPLFDFGLITRLTIGKAHWDSMSEKNRIALQTNYKNYLMNSYLNRLQEFTTQKIVFGKSSMVGTTKARIPMDIKDGNTTYHLEYFMVYQQSAWKIYDFEIEGVSIIRTYRSQFEPYLKDGRVEELIKQLK